MSNITSIHSFLQNQKPYLKLPDSKTLEVANGIKIGQLNNDKFNIGIKLRMKLLNS